MFQFVNSTKAFARQGPGLHLYSVT